MKKYFYLLAALFIALWLAPTAAALDYDITSYEGDLQLQADNSAVFTQKISYHFHDDYNGQIVTLGKAGKMPSGFAIKPTPTVAVETNGKPDTDFTSNTSDLGDGYELKIYNSGDSGDRVTVTVSWQLKNLLFVHKDIAELNWKPISDWDQDLGQVIFRVSGLQEAERSQLFAHTGYFGQPVSVKATDDGYEVYMSRLDEGRGLELHAYWDRQVLDLPASSQESDQLAAFQRTEAKIEQDTLFYHRLGQLYLPILLGLLLGLALLFYLLFKRSIRPQAKYPKDARLYEAPQDLAPLLVAANVYAVDMDEVNPTEISDARLSFENMVQATLLDLMDRGYLQLLDNSQEPVLQLLSDQGLPDFERSFLDIAFGGRKQAAVKDLFADFQISEDLYKGKKAADEATVRRVGGQIKQLFSKSLSQLADQVSQESAGLGLTSNYRPLTSKEKFLQATALALSWGSLVLAVLIFLVFLIALSGFIWYYIPLALVALGLGLAFASQAPRYKRDGVLSEEGAYSFYLWTSFSNMLRDIAHLDNTEVEGLVLWNRLLVYATLFGYADRVSKVMRLRRIHLTNPSMDLYVRANLYHHFYMSSHSFSNYGQVASTASHFSVSSGGSVGGGFSGGGGGGGGGAF